jgi:hypothetical protein
VFHVSMPPDPMTTLMPVPRAHQGSVVLTAPVGEPYDHGAASYHHQVAQQQFSPCSSLALYLSIYTVWSYGLV